LIEYSIGLPDKDEYFRKIFEKYDDGGLEIGTSKDSWKLARHKIMTNFMKEPNPMMSSSIKGAKTFEQSIIEEIVEEMREDAETHVLSQCKNKYKDIVSMSYFKIEKGIEKEGFKENDNQDDFQLADEKVWKKDKIVVMGAILYPLDSKNFQTMIAIVGEDG
jgi:hypothetical protein